MSSINENLVYNLPIDDNTDWAGDASTDFLPVAGQRVQEYLKNRFVREENKRTSEDGKLNDKIVALEKTTWPLAVTLTPTYKLEEYTGAGIIVPVTAQVKRTGKGNQPTNAINNYLATLDGVQLTGLISNSTGQFTMNPGPKDIGTHTVQFSVNSDDMQAEARMTIRIENPTWMGFSTYANVNEGLILSSLGYKHLIDGVKGTYTVQNVGDIPRYLWICLPATVGNLKQVMPDSGFKMPFEGRIQYSGYNCYRSSSRVNPGSSITFTIS